MPTNELLERKYQAQRALSAEKGEDLRAYADNLRRVVQEVESRYGLRFPRATQPPSATEPEAGAGVDEAAA